MSLGCGGFNCSAHSAGPGPWVIGLDAHGIVCSRVCLLRGLFAQAMLVVWMFGPWVSEIHPKWLKGVHFQSIWAPKSVQQGPWEPFGGARAIPNCSKIASWLPKSPKTSIKRYKNTPWPMMIKLFGCPNTPKCSPKAPQMVPRGLQTRRKIDT